MGVWIETGQAAVAAAENYVTPCMGVWIETDDRRLDIDGNVSHTLYGCVD